MLAEMPVQAVLDLLTHIGAKAVPNKLRQVQLSSFDAFLQTDAQVQGTGVLAVEVRAVSAVHILGLISEAWVI